MHNRATRLPPILSLLASTLLLGGALASQYIGGLHPCEMCHWQRWPHMAAIALSLLALLTLSKRAFSRTLTALASIALAVSGAIGLFHAGVEYGWWEGVTACSVPMAAASPKDMLDAIMAAPLTRCDVAPWSLFGISLAGYNAIFSFGAALLVLTSLRKSVNPRDWM